MKRYIYIGPAVLLLVWGIVTTFDLIDPFFLPGPIETIREAVRMIAGNIIIGDILSTLKRISIAFTIATVFGIPVGLFIGRSDKTYRSVEFLVDFFRSTPGLVLFPLFMIVFGIADASKILVTAFSSSFIVIFNAAYGVMNSKKSRVLAAKIMGATKFQMFRSVIFWESLPQTFAGMRNALAWVFAVILSTEMVVGTDSGLGHKIIDYQITYNIIGVYASILITGILGYLINLLFVVVERKVIHWSGK